MFDGVLPPLRASDERWASLEATMARAVSRQCPAWLAAEAEDIAQAALMKIAASALAGEGKPPLSSFYLHKVAHSALVDEIRRRRRRREVALEQAPSTGRMTPRTTEPVAAGTPEATARLRQLGAAVRTCLQAMSARASAGGDALPAGAHGARGRATARLGRQAHGEPRVSGIGGPAPVPAREGAHTMSASEPRDVARLRESLASLADDRARGAPGRRAHLRGAARGDAAGGQAGGRRRS